MTTPPVSPTARPIRGYINSAFRMMGLGNVPAQDTTKFGQQAAWFIDSVNGDDQRRGNTQAQAIRTYTELVKRLQGQPIEAAMTVTVLNAPLTNDRPRGVITIAEQGSIAFVAAAQTATYTGSITAITASSTPATNTPRQLTDAALPAANSWTTFLGNSAARIRVTSGARAGAICWPKRDLGARAANITRPVIPVLNAVTLIGNFPSLQVGDPFVVEPLLSAAGLPMNFAMGGKSAFDGVPRVSYTGFDFNGIFPAASGPCDWSVWYVGCAFGGPGQAAAAAAPGGNAFFVGCELGNWASTAPGLAWLVACGSTGMNCVRGSCVVFDGDHLQMGAPGLIVDGDFQWSNGGSFISSFQGVLVESNGQFSEVGTGLYGSSRVYGSGAAGVGYQTKGGVIARWTTLPTITGSTPGTNDVTIGKQATQAWGALAANGGLDALTNGAVVKL